MMSWEKILKKKFKFSDIDFKEDTDSYYSTTEVAPNLILSVIAGQGKYSAPRSKLSNPQEYEEYELAFLNKKNNEWLTKKLLGWYDDVIAYKTVAEIEDLVAKAIDAYGADVEYDGIASGEFDEDFSSKYAMER
tara:strand:- start:2165 stop:2566 length:402 start_codon:yes stop_codon:yes gene_type:complete